MKTEEPQLLPLEVDVEVEKSQREEVEDSRKKSHDETIFLAPTRIECCVSQVTASLLLIQANEPTYSGILYGGSGNVARDRKESNVSFDRASWNQGLTIFDKDTPKTFNCDL